MNGLKQFVTLLFFFAAQAYVFGQGSDMVVLKRGNKTLKTYLSNMPIHFIAQGGFEVNGVIRKIDKDTLYINIYDERRSYTMWGTSFWDTISVNLSKYHIHDIREMIKPAQGFGFIKNGFIFILSGTAYGLLHSINGLYLKQPIDPLTMGLSAGSVVTGMVLRRVYRNSVTLGKKYHLDYIPVK